MVIQQAHTMYGEDKMSGLQKGFTLIEICVVIFVLAVLATIAIPKVYSFLHSGTVAAANSELVTAQTASKAYLAEHLITGLFGNAEIQPFINLPLKGTYSFDSSGQITGTPEYPNVTWNAGTYQFK